MNFDHLLRELYPVPLLPPPPAQFATRRLSFLLAYGELLRAIHLDGTSCRLDMTYSLKERELQGEPHADAYACRD